MDATDDQIAADVRTLMEAAWREPGFCVPNQDVYPHQWLWDSCFHAVTWAAMGDARAGIELASTLAHQDGRGFVPHMTYWHAPFLHRSFWGRPMTSVITQPPMYGHALRVIVEAGLDVPDGVVDAVAAGLTHLLVDREPTPAGLVPIIHPWESGCDDSPRWDHARIPSEEWRDTKGSMVTAIVEGGTPFRVGSVGFAALVAWNTAEYLDIAPEPVRDRLAEATDRVVRAISGRWDGARRTWLDDGAGPDGGTGADDGAGAIRTLDAMVALLVDPRPEGFDELLDPNGFAAPFGLRGVHRGEATYEPDVYWRGSTWPQLLYLLAVAARRAGRADVVAAITEQFRAGAVTSGYAEHWNPETGAGLGARPQTWTGLVHVVRNWA
ncbi:MAG: hypothetical protein AAF467_04420 [Actinomycetota bacterium]